MTTTIKNSKERNSGCRNYPPWIKTSKQIEKYRKRINEVKE